MTSESTPFDVSGEDQAALAVALEEELAKDQPVVDHWKAQQGSQMEALSCPMLELLISGDRGGGKTDVLLMSYAKHVGKGFGEVWRGVIFRKSYPDLHDIIAKSIRWFTRRFPGARFNRSRSEWTFPDGEVLMFRQMSRVEDYEKYHGSELPFIGWEELSGWPDDTCYKKMFSCCRCSVPGVPKRIRSTSNPYGVGSNWIKERFNLAGQWWKTIIQPGSPNPLSGRASIHSSFRENKILLDNDPDYESRIRESATNDAMLAAWLYGNWDIIAGGMFDSAWKPQHNIVPKFDIPKSWRLDRAFDWGWSAPFSVGWYAKSDGSDVYLPGIGVKSTIKGDIFRVKEWYGWNGKANQGLEMTSREIAAGIVERELLWGWRDRIDHSINEVWPGPADSAIYSSAEREKGLCIGTDMSQRVTIEGTRYPGVSWTRADKSAGSRKTGWRKIQDMMKNAHPQKDKQREFPGLFIVGEENRHFLRTVLGAARDEKDMDEIADGVEDHLLDELRYRCREVGAGVSSGRTTGTY